MISARLGLVVPINVAFWRTVTLEFVRIGRRSRNSAVMTVFVASTSAFPALAISSTDCRNRKRRGEPVWYLVPDGVVQYIAKHDLYPKDTP